MKKLPRLGEKLTLRIIRKCVVLSPKTGTVDRKPAIKIISFYVTHHTPILNHQDFLNEHDITNKPIELLLIERSVTSKLVR